MSKSFLSYLTILLFFLSTIVPVHHAQLCSTACNYGDCVSENKCACKLGYFNGIAPCDAKVPPLYNKRYAQKIIPGNGWVYSYIPLGDITSDIQLQFQALEGTTIVYISLQAPDSYKLPTDRDDSLLIFPTNHVDNTRSYHITRQKVQATKGGWLTVAFYNVGSEQARVRVQYIATINSSGSSDVNADNNGVILPGDIMNTVILTPLVVASVIICAIVYVRSKAERLRTRHQNRRDLQLNSRDPRQIYELFVAMSQTPYAPQKIVQEKKLLSQEELQHYFPKQAFSQLKSPFPQGTCSICLEDFAPESECHQFYCCHIFHETCIGDWLAKHDSCPDCRKPMTREAIKKIIKTEKQRIQQEQSALLSRQSPNQSPTQDAHHAHL